MIGSSKKGLPVLIASLAVTSAMFAGSGDVKPNNCKGTTLCHTRPDIDSNDFMIDIGFLLEQARVTGTSYMYTLGNGASAGADTQVTTGRRPSFNLDWGLTVAVGRHFEHDDWDLKLGFDWINSTGKDSTSTDFNEIAIPVGVRTVGGVDGSSDFTYADTGSSNLKVRYYMFDAMLGRGSFMGSCHHITPHIGIKAAWISYSGTTKFAGGALGTTDPEFYTIRRSEGFWGVGPQVGVNGVWGMAEGIGFFADNKMAILLGQGSIKDVQSSTGGISMTYNESNIPVLSPTFKIFLGLQYEKTVYYGCQHLRLRGGWDTVFYFNQYMNTWINNQLPATGDAGVQFRTEETNNFGLTGLRIDLCYDF